MEKQFDVIDKTRTNFLNLVNSLTIEQLNKIPEGFNNNIAWNFGHAIVSQQVLCYTRAGIKPRVDEALIKKYQKGSKPESFIDSEEIELLKKLLFSLIDDLQTDMKENKFGNYQPVATSFGVDLNCVEDTIPYFSMHDGIHLGYALAIRKFV
jgi:DinB superfamily